MNIRTKSLIGLTVLSVAGATVANAQTAGTLTQNIDTGHYYQVFGKNDFTWDQSQAHVLTLPCIATGGIVDLTCLLSGAVSPHLATITSSREDDFVDGLRHDSRFGTTLVCDPACTIVLTRSQTWLGGDQDSGGTEPGGGWRWVNMEGNFPGINGGTVYANWAVGEPNNSGDEKHLGVGLNGLGAGWNDEQALGNIGGFIVEWDVPKELEDCEAGEGGCVTIEGHTLEFEDDSIPEGATLSFNSFEFLDPRVDLNENLPSFLHCNGTMPLTIFGGSGFGPATLPEMRIPGYLCGSPKFIVITVDTGEFFLEDGTVLVTNNTATVLPGNRYPDGGMSDCEDPIFQDPYTDGDPQYQDVVVWQTTDPAGMLEDELGAAAGFPGATGEFTFDCGGSSRGRTRGGSDFGIGFHIDFGHLNAWAGNSAGNFGRFVDLTDYKLQLLKKSVKNARVNGSLKQGDYKKMQQQIKNAIKKLDRGNYSGALGHVNKFLKFVNKANYATVTGENDNGEHIMRGGNIEFMLRVKIIPYAP